MQFLELIFDSIQQLQYCMKFRIQSQVPVQCNCLCTYIAAIHYVCSIVPFLLSYNYMKVKRNFLMNSAYRPIHFYARKRATVYILYTYIHV